MCEAECFGNYHRKCNHYVKLYESGLIIDCMNPNCGLSTKHCHSTQPSSGFARSVRACVCSKTYEEKRRVLNLIQDMCDACRTAAWAKFDRENGEW